MHFVTLVSELVRLVVPINLLLGRYTLVNVRLVGVAFGPSDPDLALGRSFPQYRQQNTPTVSVVLQVRLIGLRNDPIDLLDDRLVVKRHPNVFPPLSSPMQQKSYRLARKLLTSLPYTTVAVFNGWCLPKKIPQAPVELRPSASTFIPHHFSY